MPNPSETPHSTPRGAPRRDFIYWAGVLVMAASMVATIRQGWSGGAAACGFFLGVVLVVPTAYSAGRRRA